MPTCVTVRATQLGEDFPGKEKYPTGPKTHTEQKREKEKEK